MIIVSDGKPLGTNTTEKDVLRSLERAKSQGINVIGIGTPPNMMKPFVFNIDYVNSKKSMRKFINAYTAHVQSG